MFGRPAHSVHSVVVHHHSPHTWLPDVQRTNTLVLISELSFHFLQRNPWRANWAVSPDPQATWCWTAAARSPWRRPACSSSPGCSSSTCCPGASSTGSWRCPPTRPTPRPCCSCSSCLTSCRRPSPSRWQKDPWSWLNFTLLKCLWTLCYFQANVGTRAGWCGLKINSQHTVYIIMFPLKSFIDAEPGKQNQIWNYSLMNWNSIVYLNELAPNKELPYVAHYIMSSLEKNLKRKLRKAL